MLRKIQICAVALLISHALMADIQLSPVSFQQLPGWQETNVASSLSAFQKSCQLILSQKEMGHVGTADLPITQQDWVPICTAAMKVSLTSAAAHAFFSDWFIPMQVTDDGAKKGLFTGYYLPTIPASLTRTSTYTVPIYGQPNDLVIARLGDFDSTLQGKKISGRIQNGQMLPYNVSQQQIKQGALNNKVRIILWAKSNEDLFFLQMQGSGIAQLPNGTNIMLTYAGDNGGTPVSIRQWLISHHIMTAKTITAQKIHQWLLANPKQARALMKQNKSFVFFKILNSNTAIGAESAPLTSGYSLAIDNSIIPLGIPIWLSTEVPRTKYLPTQKTFHRLMIAQDTGGAIKGVIRGDVFFGAGNKAVIKAGDMRSPGKYWLLIPKTFSRAN